MTEQFLPSGTKLVCIKRLGRLFTDKVRASPPEVWTVMKTEYEVGAGLGYFVRHADRKMFIYAHRIGEYFEVLE